MHNGVEGAYLYCIIRCSEPRQFTSPGIGGRGDAVYTLHHRDLAAVVSASPMVEYDNNRRNMLAHTAVLEEVMREFTILPVRFGIIANDTTAVEQQVLAARYAELDALLDQMEGRVELGLKAFWREDVIFREIIESNPPIRQIRDSLTGLPAEQTYYERIRLGELVEAAMVKLREADSARILDHLAPLAYDTRVNPVITDRMVLNAAFMVDRACEHAFDQAVQHLDAQIGHRMIFKYVGSVPPYDFVNLTISWSR